MYGNEWNQYMYELQQYIQQQDSKIIELENRIRALEEAQQKSSGTTIENIEYKFDQLKIETLSGSLHIGLSPEELQNMEDFALGQTNQLNPENSMSPFDQQLNAELQHWFQTAGPRIIRDLANENSRSIDESHESMLMQDIRNQFPERIRFYKEQASNDSSTVNKNDLKDYILNHIQKEIHQSLKRYIQNNKGDEVNDNGSS